MSRFLRLIFVRRFLSLIDVMSKKILNLISVSHCQDWETSWVSFLCQDWEYSWVFISVLGGKLFLSLISSSKVRILKKKFCVRSEKIFDAGEEPECTDKATHPASTRPPRQIQCQSKLWTPGSQSALDTMFTTWTGNYVHNLHCILGSQSALDTRVTICTVHWVHNLQWVLGSQFALNTKFTICYEY